MANENFLGAPTEGLGQTVTFAAGSQGSMPQAGAGQRVQQRDEVQGGFGVNPQRAQHIQERAPDPTMGVLFKMGAEILAPAIKAEQEAGFVRGMQQAAAGQAITDIVDEQPWYSKVFGTTNLVDGARAYTASAKATEIATSIDAAMPDLRKLDGRSFADHVHKQVANASTGDSATDTMVFQQAMKQMPHYMVQQAKQHYVYQQERFVEAQVSNYGAAVTNLGLVLSKASKGEAQSELTIGSETTDAFDGISATLATVEALRRPDGQDEGMHSHSVASILGAAAQEGNLAAVYALVDGAGLKLRPADEAYVRKALAYGERKIRTDLDAASILAIGTFAASRARPDMTPEEAVAESLEFNKKWKLAHGSREDVIPAGSTAREVTQILERNAAKAEHEYDVNAKAAEKAFEANEKQRLKNENLQDAAASLIVGGPVMLKTNEEKAELWVHLRKTKSDSQFFATMVNGQDRLINEEFKDSMQTGIRMSANAANHLALYEQYVSGYRKFRDAGALGAEAAAKYSGEFANRMDAYHRTIEAETGGDFNKVTPQLQLLALSKFNNPPAPSSHSDKKDSVSSKVKSHIEGMNNIAGFQLAYGKMPVDEALVTKLTDEVMAGAKDVPHDLEASAIYRVGTAAAGIEQFGGKYWHKRDGMVPIDSALVKPYASEADRKAGKSDANQIQPSEMDAAIRHSMRLQLKLVGGELDKAEVIRLPDTGDKDKDVQLWVLAPGAAGTVDVKLTGAMIRQQWAEKKTVGLREEIAAQRARIKTIASGYTAFGMTNPKKDLPPEQDKLNELLRKAGLPTE